MNKKLLAGFSMLVTVGAFWACGDGSINKMDVADELMATQYNSGDPEKDLENSKALKDKALKDCENDPICKAEYADYLANPDAPPPTSSEGSTTPTSASSNSGGGTPVSSSSHFITAVSSASETGPGNLDVSSSSEAAQPVTGLGSCAPEKTPISKGESVAWVFKGNGTNAVEFAQGKGSLEWSFNPEGAVAGEAASTLQSAPITYATPGKYNAKVIATIGLENEPIDCSPLQVDGDPITDCSCSPDAAAPDVAGGAVTVTWTVSGCKSNSPIKDVYKWTGATGTTATATAEFKTKDQEITPVVEVSNDDGTTKEFTCAAAKAIDATAPDYEITTPQDAGKILVKAGSVSVTVSISGYTHFNCSPAPGGASLNGGSISCGAKKYEITNEGQQGEGYQVGEWYTSITCSEKVVDVSLQADAYCSAY